MPRLNDKQRFNLLDAKFQEREGSYRRGLRMTQEKIKAWCSAYHRKGCRLIVLLAPPKLSKLKLPPAPRPRMSRRP